MQVATKDKATWSKNNINSVEVQGWSNETMIYLSLGDFAWEGGGRSHSKEKPWEQAWNYDPLILLSSKKVSTRGLYWGIKLYNLKRWITVRLSDKTESTISHSKQPPDIGQIMTIG